MVLHLYAAMNVLSAKTVRKKWKVYARIVKGNW